MQKPIIYVSYSLPFLTDDKLIYVPPVELGTRMFRVVITLPQIQKILDGVTSICHNIYSYHSYVRINICAQRTGM